MSNRPNYLSEDFPKPLSIDVGSKHTFRNYKKIIEWSKNELAFYEKLGNPNNMDNVFNAYIIKAIEDELKHVGNNRTDFFEQLKKRIEINFKTYGLISSKSKAGKWLLKQHKSKPSLTIGSFNYFSSKVKGKENDQIFQRSGEFAAFLFDAGAVPNFDMEEEVYKDFYSSILKEKDEILSELLEIKEENKSLNQIIQNQNKDWEKSFTDQKAEVAKKFDDEYMRHQTKMNEAEEFYEKKLAVKNAVTYWSKKASGHKINSIIFGSISGVLMITAIVIMFHIGKYLVGLDLSDKNGIGRKLLTETGALQLWVYGFFVISMTLFIWIVRLLVKVFLSNLHLLSDAKERETMIQTYLAFEREENTLKDTDRDLILPAIFRVSSNGIIKDDSQPNTPLNVITKKFTQ
ncbi:DUF6161 domain-containing protein [Flammeovirgaceae bacterium SG7u.111]|nr:DUF6161 domain-containing protein [Flammeovirgaceae bacterium SG7u.132]WPO34067.1 DUF6161 domain-containing protein [Flammeovirgaceae bacterium SG7u.111]